MTRPATILLTVVATLWSGCARRDVATFWQAGDAYQLMLTKERPLVATPSGPRRPIPMRDSVVLRLTADSVRRDTVYGRIQGKASGFPSPFTAVGGDRFVASHDGTRWHITVTGPAPDTGLTLDGEVLGERIIGIWKPRVVASPGAVFIIAPAT